MSYIAQKLKEKYLSEICTTKDLIYKKKIVKPEDIYGSYLNLASKKIVTPVADLKFGDKHMFLHTVDSKPLNDLLYLFSKNINSNINTDHQLKKFKISEIQNSLWIEGIKSSKGSIRKTINGQLADITEEKDIIAKNYDEGFNFILNTNEINESTLFTLYTILSKDLKSHDKIEPGSFYRKSGVKITGYAKEFHGIDSSQINESMETMFKHIKNVIDNQNAGLYVEVNGTNLFGILEIIAIHYFFEIIHPYYDMNGRVGRLLILWFARISGMLNQVYYASEAINLFKEEFYYDAFKKSEEKEFKFDITYFIASMISSLIGQRVAYKTMKKIEGNIHRKDNFINSLEKEIIISLLTKENKYYKIGDFLMAASDINPAQLSRTLKKLEKLKVIKSQNTKPKIYSLNWTDEIMEWINAEFIDEY